jgi:hypothetical protein
MNTPQHTNNNGLQQEILMTLAAHCLFKHHFSSGALIAYCALCCFSFSPVMACFTTKRIHCPSNQRRRVDKQVKGSGGSIAAAAQLPSVVSMMVGGS